MPEYLSPFEAYFSYLVFAAVMIGSAIFNSRWNPSGTEGFWG